LGWFIFCDEEMSKTPSRQNTLKKILIIHTDGNSFNNPSLKCIIDLLLEKGCEIDLRYPKSDAPMPHHEGIRFLPFGIWMWRWKYGVFNRYCFRPLVLLSVLVEKFIYYKKYDLIMGVDRQGLIEASALNKLTKTPYIYISFEISFEDETSARYKSLEKDASKNVAAWLVQDEVRASLLQRENTLDPANKILLPLASAGVGVAKADRLRDRLGIPDDKKVAIAIGAISKWTMTSQIMQCVADWPEEWVLVVHDRFGQTRELLAGELAAFTNLLNRRIYISDAASEMVDDMGGILAGISAGLAFYKPEYGTGPFYGKNLEYLGLASGKISTCLRYGVPVIINEVGLYAEEARKYRFGCVVEGPEQIKDCLNEISREEYRHNAKEYFVKKLDFNIYRDMIWSRFEALVNGA
jgi:glycosyltransferase involved in cell wall biosynthesis